MSSLKIIVPFNIGTRKVQVVLSAGVVIKNARIIKEIKAERGSAGKNVLRRLEKCGSFKPELFGGNIPDAAILNQIDAIAVGLYTCPPSRMRARVIFKLLGGE